MELTANQIMFIILDELKKTLYINPETHGDRQARAEGVTLGICRGFCAENSGMVPDRLGFATRILSAPMTLQRDTHSPVTARRRDGIDARVIFQSAINTKQP